MSEPRISPRASEDLVEIWSYIADDSMANADSFIDKLYETMQVLSRQPGSGRHREELVSVIQSFPFGRYIIFFERLTPGLKLCVSCTEHGISRISSRANGRYSSRRKPNP
jgi:toxin ParE1/3/4